MPVPTPPQSIASSYTWQRLFDMQRRLGAASISVNGQDALDIVNQVSSFAYTKYLWPFTLQTTPDPNSGSPSIPCVNLKQDYAAPAGLRVISRAWFNVPNTLGAANFGTVPPYDDPSFEALYAAELSADYVGSLGYPGGVPLAYTYPGSGSLDVVKRLGVNLTPWGYTSIRAITQQPNNGLIRLQAATAVNLNQPYSLELEYQPVRPPVASLAESCWMPDEYINFAQAGILYFLYLYNNDPRAGVASYGPTGSVSYSGQYAVYMAALESAAAAERAGSVDNFVPDQSLGADYGSSGGFWFA